MAMPKLNLDEFIKNNKGHKLLIECEDTEIRRLPNGEVLKILDNMLLELLSNTGFSLEKRLDEVDNLTSFTNFAMPNRKLEENGIVNSYTMPYVPGVDFTDFYEDIYNLSSYANIHSQIENNIKIGNELGIVFPDLCTTENIRITPDRKVFFIDYDGLQIKQMPAVGFSDFLGIPSDVLTKKYFDFETNLFTKEIDIKSAIFLYFVDVFGVDLSKVGSINPFTGRVITLDYIFSTINLQDLNIMQKVWKLFQQSVPNEFLGDDIYMLAEQYNLVELPGTSIKRLVRK